MSAAERRESFAPGRLWSLWDLMKAFNLGFCCSAFKMLGVYAMGAMAADPKELLSEEDQKNLDEGLRNAQVFAIVLELTESNSAIKRYRRDLKSEASFADVDHGLRFLMGLLESEMEKRKVFSIEPDKAKYFQSESYGGFPPARDENALFLEKQVPLFGNEVHDAFPSAYMDIVEAGRCLALERNNAAIYHLMQAAEIGLRTLAWDRRVVVHQGKQQSIVPLEYAQWGQIIGELEKKIEAINHWTRSKAAKTVAHTYYKDALFEVASFNEIYRKHISHARNTVYEIDVAISCWGHVHRFMKRLSQRMSEKSRTPTVWSAKEAKAS